MDRVDPAVAIVGLVALVAVIGLGFALILLASQQRAAVPGAVAYTLNRNTAGRLVGIALEQT